MRAKLSKPMLGDCSINRRLTNTKRMTNGTADFWKPPKSFRSDLLTPRDGLFSAPRMVSRPAGYPRSIYQPVWSPSCIRHVIWWPHARDNGVTEPVNGRTKEELREMCKGGAQNATCCWRCLMENLVSSSTVPATASYIATWFFFRWMTFTLWKHKFLSYKRFVIHTYVWAD